MQISQIGCSVSDGCDVSAACSAVDVSRVVSVIS